MEHWCPSASAAESRPGERWGSSRGQGRGRAGKDHWRQTPTPHPPPPRAGLRAKPVSRRLLSQKRRLSRTASARPDPPYWLGGRAGGTAAVGGALGGAAGGVGGGGGGTTAACICITGTLMTGNCGLLDLTVNSTCCP